MPPPPPSLSFMSGSLHFYSFIWIPFHALLSNCITWLPVLSKGLESYWFMSHLVKAQGHCDIECDWLQDRFSFLPLPCVLWYRDGGHALFTESIYFFVLFLLHDCQYTCLPVFICFSLLCLIHLSSFSDIVLSLSCVFLSYSHCMLVLNHQK